MRSAMLAATLILLPAISPGAALDFEGFPVGTFLTTEFQASDSVVFLENARIHFLGVGHATSGVLGLYNSGTPISAEFRLPGNIPAITDLVSIKGDLIPIQGNVTLEAFDINGVLIGSDVKPDSPAPATLSVAAAGIHRIRFFSQSGTVAFDDLTFNTPVESSDQVVVPEPGSVMLMLGGGLGLIAIRRHKSARHPPTDRS